MPRFNNCLTGGRGNGRGNGAGPGMGGFGMRLRDGSCQGQGLGQGNRLSQSQNASGPGFFNRFFTGGNSANSTSGAKELLSAIKDLQQQIDELKNQSGK
jgi:hypothetical protein